MTTQAATMLLGPAGALREIPSGPEYTVDHERSSSDLVTMGGYRRVSRGLRSAREWSVDQHWMTRDEDAYVLACASGAVPGPLYLYTNDAARSNLFHDDFAAPSPWARPALGTTAGTLSVPIEGVPTTTRGVVQQASAGAWSSTVPLRQGTRYVLSAWSSGAGAAIEWRMVYSGGGVASWGTITTGAVEGGFYGAAEPGSGSTAGVQVRLAAGSLTVGGLRLVEGVLPTSGTITRRNLIPNPTFALDTATWTARGGTLVTRDWPQMWAGQRGDRVRTGQLTSDGTSAYLGIEQPMTTTPVVGGQWIAVSALIAGDPEDNIGCRMDVLCNTPTGYTFHLSGSFQPAPFYAGRRITWAFQAPATTTTFGVRAQMFSGATGTMIPAGRRLWLGDVHAATAATEAEALAQVQAYFDGSTPPAPGRYITWDGTPHASPSTEYVLPDGATFPGWMPGRGVPQVVVDDPAETVAASSCLGAPRRAQAYTLREVGR